MGKAATGKPKGRTSAYAYFVKTCRDEHRNKYPNENVVFSEFSKKCADLWKPLSDHEKQKYHRMAQTDKERYESEMSNYTAPAGDKKRKRAAKDPNAPKRALSAFFWFCNDERPNVKGELGSEASVTDVAKELGRRWNSCGEDVKAKYNALAAKDKARYEKSMTNYKSGKTGATSAPKPKEDSDDDDDDDEEEEEYDDDE
jgi:hypothetical protein